MNYLWLARNLRLTIFTPQAITADDFNAFWLNAVGVEFENEESRPTIGLRKRTASIEAGVTAVVATQPGRLDFIIQANVVEELKLDLGEWDKPKAEFHARCAKGLDNISSECTRLAYAGEAWVECENRQRSYEHLAALIPRLKFTGDEVELNFQVNRPRPSQVLTGTDLNRIARWSSLIFQSSVGSLSGPEVSLPPRVFTLLGFDISTAAERATPIAKDQLLLALQELEALCELLLEKGDAA